MKGSGYVYMITSPTNRIYIGSTNNITRRWKEYIKLDCKSQSKLYRSLYKYGYKGHKFEILWEGEIEDMFKYERLCGDFYEVLDKNKGMNLRLPGYEDIPNIISEESRAKMSKSGRTKTFTEKHRQNLSLSAGKRSHSKETRDKMSLARKDKKFPRKAITEQ